MACMKKKETKANSERFSIDKSLSQNDTIRLLSKFPELRLFPKEKLSSKTRTAYVIQNVGIHLMDNYKCNAVMKMDTL